MYFNILVECIFRYFRITCYETMFYTFRDVNDLGQVNENDGPECPRPSPRPRTSRLAMSRRHHKMWTNNSQVCLHAFLLFVV